MQLPLNALRMFDAAARHLSLTRAAQELHVTQAAVSQHIRNLEERLGKPLFRRLPRGLALTDEGHALWPAVAESFARIEHSLQQVAEPRPREVLTVGVVGTFAIGWLIPSTWASHVVSFGKQVKIIIPVPKASHTRLYFSSIPLFLILFIT